MKYFRRLVSAFVLLFVCVVIKAQQNHFIYLQTENKQPFYVKIGKVIYNSTISGYLIIPKLKEGNYDLSVGFVNSENGEQKFKCTVARQDIGYIVKKFGEKGWGLFNLQTLQVTMAGLNKPHREVETNTVVKTDDFSNMLSTVVNDPAIKYEEKETEPPKIINTDTLLIATVPSSESSKAIAKIDVKNPNEAIAETKPANSIGSVSRKPDIVKSTALMGKDGLNLVYLDREEGKIDTIALLIPMIDEVATDSIKSIPVSLPSSSSPETDKSEVLKKDTSQNLEDGMNADDKNPNFGETSKVKKSKSQIKEDTGREKPLAAGSPDEDDKKFLNIPVSVNELPGKDSSEQVKDKATTSAVTDLIVSSNTSCAGYGNEADFLKLRKKMAAADSEDDMLSIAKKAFKSKCYSTSQVKNLGVLFLNDAGRYNFFDLSYPHVYDLNNFKELENQLIEQYYKTRFKAMLRQ